MSITAESGGVVTLRALIESASDKAPAEVHKVLRKGALNIKKDAQKKISGVAHAPHYPRAITFDSTWAGTSGVAEIGPDKDKVQGALGNILEYGTSNNAPLSHLGPALDYEGPNFERALADLGEDLLS